LSANFQGTYVGNIVALHGKRALLRFSKKIGFFLAQFDDTALDKKWTHGWTEFPFSDFIRNV